MPGMWLLISALWGCVPQSKYLELESQYDACQRKLDRCGERQPNPDRSALLEQLRPLVQRGLLTVKDEDGRTTVQMKAEVLFPSGSAELSPSGRETVAEVARILARQTPGAYWQIEGHTDTEPISTEQFPSNWHLGASRAIAVLQVMLAHGMDNDRLSAATFGEFTPVASNGTPTGRAENRRIELVLLPEVSGKRLPGGGGGRKKAD
jgi:chemotaxis protein MotB